MTAGRNHISKFKDYCTPPKYVKAVKEVFGGKISLDPCSNEYSFTKAETEYILPEHDGLEETWNFPTIYVNPPYGRFKGRKTSIYDWFKRCYEAYKKYGSEVIALVPVAVNTKHWKHYVFGKATAVCFLYDTRLRFWHHGIELTKGSSMACAMIYWGENFQAFYDVFMNHGAVVDLRPMEGEIIGKKRAQKSLKIKA